MIVKDAAIVYSDGMTPVAFHVLWPPRLPALSDAIILSSPKEISDGLDKMIAVVEGNSSFRVTQGICYVNTGDIRMDKKSISTRLHLQ